MSKTVKKIIWMAGSVAVFIVAFCNVPKLQKKLENILYKKMR